MHKKTGLLVIDCLLQFSAALLAQAAPGTILWIHEIRTGIISSPAVGSGGIIYLGTGTGLYAITNLENAASNIWTFPAPSVRHVAIGADGTIYCGGYDGLYAVDPAGRKKWFYPVQGGTGGLAIGRDETLCFGGAGYLNALTLSGALKWHAAYGGYSSPAIGPDGTIYVSLTLGRQLYAVHADGSQKWARNLANDAGDSLALGSDGTIYVAGGGLYAFTPEGTNLWRAGTFAKTSPVVASDGTIYIASSLYPYALHQVTSAGQVSPTGATENIRYASPKCAAIDAGGTIWYCASNTVWALDANGQVLTWSRVIDDGYWSPETSPVIGSDGTLFSARGSRLYAIATGTKGPADSPWPMYGGNARHTGQLEKPALKPPQKRSDANFNLQVYAQVGKDCSLESSTNLGVDPWTPWTNFLTTNVPMDVADLTASNSPVKFYRAVEK